MKNFLRRLFHGGRRRPEPGNVAEPMGLGPDIDTPPDTTSLIKPRPDPMDRGPQAR